MLVDGIAANDVIIVESYGFKKVLGHILPKKVFFFYPIASPVGFNDFFMSKELFQKVHKGLLARYKMTADDLKIQLKFKCNLCLLMHFFTFRTLSFA